MGKELLSIGTSEKNSYDIKHMKRHSVGHHRMQIKTTKNTIYIY